MTRIILPIAMALAAFLGPWYTAELFDKAGEAENVVRTGQYYAGATVDCFLDKNFSLSGNCTPKKGLEGLSVFATVAGGLVAACIGVIGLLPFIGRFTSLLTAIAGGIGLASIAYFLFGISLGDTKVWSDVMWGVYATGGLGFLTLVSGLTGMAGNRD